MQLYIVPELFKCGCIGLTSNTFQPNAWYSLGVNAFQKLVDTLPKQISSYPCKMCSNKILFLYF